MTVESGDAGQRIDNYLLRMLRGVPRTHVYRLLRKGEVRVNGGRKKATYRLDAGDRVRLPPVRDTRHADGRLPPALRERLRTAVLYEDARALVIDKPAGLAVHAGSGLAAGAIDGLRELRPDLPGIELVHRLDRDTSGCLMFARDRGSLRALQAALRAGQFEKIYAAVLVGDWHGPECTVDRALRRDVLVSGERMVRPDPAGKPARSHFRRLAGNGAITLVQVALETGRTHQIRVHAAALGHPVLGDDKYGEPRAARTALGRKPARMYLHAWRLGFPGEDAPIQVDSPLPEAFAEGVDDIGAHTTP